MKKFFKFFAVALVAGCMFTACGDKEENNGENGNNGNNGNNDQIEAGINVSFGTNNWKAADDYQAIFYQNNAYLMAGKEAGLSSFPVVNIYATTATGSVSANFDESTFGYDNAAISTVDYYYETALTNSDQTAQYGDYWAKTATWNVTAFDATSLKISAKCEAVMFSALEAFVQSYGAVGVANASTMNLTVKMGEIVLTAQK